MNDLLEKLLSNLLAQRQAMVQDDVAQVLKLIEEQEVLALELNSYLAQKPTLMDQEQEKLHKVAQLVESNQLLAQQSLAFSRRMLRVLAGEEGYGEDGNVNMPRTKNVRVDIRA